MAKPLPIILNSDQQREICNLCNNENEAPSIRNRALVIYFASQGLSDEEIRNTTGNKVSTIREWRRAYIARGIDGISNKSGRYGTTFAASASEQQTRMLQPGIFLHPYVIDELGNRMELTPRVDWNGRPILIPQQEVLDLHGLDLTAICNFQNIDYIPTFSVPSTLAYGIMTNAYSFLKDEAIKKTDNESGNNCKKRKFVFTVHEEDPETGEIISKKDTSIILDDKIEYESTLSCGLAFSNAHKILCDAVDSLCKDVMEGWSKSAFLNEHKEEDANTCIIETYRGRMTFTLPKELKSSLGSRGMMWDPFLLQNAMYQVSISSYREGVTSINNLLRRNEDEKINYRTVHNKCVEEGKKIDEFEEVFSNEVLTSFGFDPETLSIIDEKKLPNEVMSVKFNEANFNKTTELALEYMQNYNDKCEAKEHKIKESVLFNKTPVYHPSNYVVLCLDIVFVPRQKSERKNDKSDDDTLIIDKRSDQQKNVCKKSKKASVKERKKNPNIKKNQREKKKRERKKLASAVITITSMNGSINIVADNMLKALRFALAILLKYNMLVNNYLLFFTDGEEEINSLIKQVFSFREYTILLDWIHLKKKCYEYLTSIIKGGKKNYERNEEIRSYFYSILFAGNVDEANEYLDNLDPNLISDRSKIDELKKYLEKKRQYIYSYAVRKGLHMINASNRVEKANDTIVSSRCKNNGTSWTQPGLNGMRNVRCIYSNNEEETWFSKNTLSCKPYTLNKNKMLENAKWIDKCASQIMAA